MMYRAAFAVGLTLVLTGCGLLPRAGAQSTALQVADAMGVPAEDMSREDFTARIKAGSSDRDSAQNNQNIDAAMHSLIARDPTLFLMSGFMPAGIASNTHIAAWVPETMAVDGKAAVVVADKAFRKASAEVYGNTSQDKAQIEATPTKYIMGVAYGEGSPVHSVTQLVQMATGHTPSLGPAPTFLTAQGKAYGPLFLGIHGQASDNEDLEKIERLSSLLPDWFYIYNPGLAKVSPATVLNKGKHLPFIEPK